MQIARRIFMVQFVILFVICLPNRNSFGQSQLDQVQKNLIKIESGLFKGLTLKRDGKEFEPGVFCGECEKIFAISPKALDAAKTARTLKIIGWPLYFVGVGMLITDFVGLSAESGAFIKKENGENKPTNLTWILLVGGAVTGFTGLFMAASSYNYVVDAVNFYNDDVFNMAKKGEKLPVGLLLDPESQTFGLTFSKEF